MGALSQHRADDLGGVYDHGVGGMRVFERGFRVAVPEQPADGEDSFALPQGYAGMGMTKIVKTNVAQVRLGPDAGPEMVEPSSTLRPSGPGRREDPAAGPFDAVEDVPCRAGEPDGSGPRLAVAQKEPAFPVVGPAQCQDLALAASGEEKKAHERDLERMPAGMGGQHRRTGGGSAPGARVITDGWSGYGGLPDHDHTPKIVGTTPAHLMLRWSHRVFSNLKRWVLGTFHGLRRPHLHRYLDEFVFRWNRRRHTATAFDALLGIGTRLKPAGYRDIVEQRA